MYLLKEIANGFTIETDSCYGSGSPEETYAFKTWAETVEWIKDNPPKLREVEEKAKEDDLLPL